MLSQTLTGQYFSVIYRGNPIIPVFLVLLALATFWWLLRKYRKVK